MNVFLRTNLFRNAFNFKPEAQWLDYRSAYSLFPGRIRVEGLVLRGSDDSVQWILRIDKVSFSVSPLDLVRRRFHASRIGADGLSMRLRLKSDDLDPDRLAALPEIAGFADPPLPVKHPPKPPLSDQDYKLWAIELEGVDAVHVREIWIDALRYAGDTHVHGRWLFRPLRWLDVGPATIDLIDLEVGYGRIPLATEIHGTVSATVHPYDLRAAKGMKIFEHISADARFDGIAEVASTFGIFVAAKDARFEHGTGPFEARLLLGHGVFAPGTHVTVRSPGSELHIADVSLKASASVDLRVDAAPGKESMGSLAFEVADLTVEKPPAEARAKLARVELRTPKVSLSEHSFEGAELTASVREAETSAVAAWKRLSPGTEDVDVESGSLAADAHLEGSLSRRVAHGELSFRGRHLAIAHRPYRVTSDVEGTVVLDEGAFGRANLGGSHLELHDALLQAKGLQAHAASLSIEAPRALFEAHRTPDFELTARFPRIDVPMLQGLQSLLPPKSALAIARGQATIAGAAMYDSHAETLTAGATVQLNAVQGQIEGLAVEVPSLTARAPRVVVDRNGPSGIVSVDLPELDVPDLAALNQILQPSKHFAINRGAGRAAMRFDANLQTRAFDGAGEIGALGLEARIGSENLTGDLTLSVRATSRGPDIDLASSTLSFNGTDNGNEWWSRLLLPEAEMRLRGGFRFKSGLRLSAKDASPITRYVVAHSPIPGWLLRTISTDNLESQGQVLTTPTSLELRGLQAHAGGVAVQMEYAKNAPGFPGTDGAILIEYGPFHFGVGLTNEGSNVVLISPERWFRDRADRLRSRPASW